MTAVPILMLGNDYVSGRAPLGYARGDNPLFGYDLGPNEIFTGALDSKGRQIYADDSGLPDYPHVFVIDQYGIKTKAEGRKVTAAPGYEAPKTSTGISFDTIWAQIGPALKTGIENTPAIIAAIRNKNPGMSEAEAAKVAQYGQSKMSMSMAMPWIVIGGVGLVAVLLLAGTRKH